MKIWKNTSTLDGFDNGINFTENKKDADIALLGSKAINLNEFPNLKGIFRAGISRDNVPEKEAQEKGVLVKFPSKETIEIIFDETASFTCSLIFRILYSNVGSLNPWLKEPRLQLSQKKLLIIGAGNIGARLVQLMKPFMQVLTFDILQNKTSHLKQLIHQADCISLHIPKIIDNISFIDKEKLSWMKDGAALINTARGEIVDEDALYDELEKGRIKAAFDVYWHEPYKGKLNHFYPDHFFMTPHVASTCKGFLEGCRRSLDDLIKDLECR